MEKKDKQAVQVDRVMDSLEGIRRADPGPWFFSRLSQRVVAQKRSMWYSIGAVLSRPSVAIGGIAAVLLLNLGFLLTEQKEVKTAARTQQVSENDYIMASNGSFDYENLVQP